MPLNKERETQPILFLATLRQGDLCGSNLIIAE